MQKGANYMQKTMSTGNSNWPFALSGHIHAGEQVSQWDFRNKGR